MLLHGFLLIASVWGLVLPGMAAVVRPGGTWWRRLLVLASAGAACTRCCLRRVVTPQQQQRLCFFALPVVRVMPPPAPELLHTRMSTHADTWQRCRAACVTCALLCCTHAQAQHTHVSACGCVQATLLSHIHNHGCQTVR